MEKKVTVREVKKALELAGVDVKEVFNQYGGWNDKRKNGRRIKLPYNKEILNTSTCDEVADILSSMFPTHTISVKNHKSVHSIYKYTSLTVHVKEL